MAGKTITARVRFRVQQQELKLANRSLDQMKAKLLGANNAATGLTGRLYRMATAFAAFSVGQRAIGGLLSSITTGERMMAQLNVLEGGLDKAGVKWKEMLRFARETPFQIEENMTAYIALKGRGLDPSYEAMTAYGNVSAALGVRINDMTDAIAGSVVGLQQRLRNLGVGVKTNANTIEFTVQGVTTTVARNSKAIQAFWKNAGNIVFANAMALQMNTLGGRLSNLKDVLFEVALAVGEGTTGNGLSASLQGVIAWLDAVGQSGYGAARAFGDKLAAAVKKLGELLKWLVGHAEQVERAVRLMFATMAARWIIGSVSQVIGVIRAFAMAASAAQAAVLLVPAAIALLGIALEDIYVFMKGGKSLIGYMMGEGAEAGQARNALREFFEGVKEPVDKMLDAITQLIRVLIPTLSVLLQSLAPAIGPFLTGVSNMVSTFAGIVGYVAQLLQMTREGTIEAEVAAIRMRGAEGGKSFDVIEQEVDVARKRRAKADAAQAAEDAKGPLGKINPGGTGSDWLWTQMGELGASALAGPVGPAIFGTRKVFQAGSAVGDTVGASSPSGQFQGRAIRQSQAESQMAAERAAAGLPPLSPQELRKAAWESNQNRRKLNARNRLGRMSIAGTPLFPNGYSSGKPQSFDFEPMRSDRKAFKSEGKSGATISFDANSIVINSGPDADADYTARVAADVFQKKISAAMHNMSDK